MNVCILNKKWTKLQIKVFKKTVKQELHQPE